MLYYRLLKCLKYPKIFVPKYTKLSFRYIPLSWINRAASLYLSVYLTSLSVFLVPSYLRYGPSAQTLSILIMVFMNIVTDSYHDLRIFHNDVTRSCNLEYYTIFFRDPGNRGYVFPGSGILVSCFPVSGNFRPIFPGIPGSIPPPPLNNGLI